MGTSTKSLLIALTTFFAGVAQAQMWSPNVAHKCESLEPFDAFVKRFANDKAFALNRAKYPVAYSEIVYRPGDRNPGQSKQALLRPDLTLHPTMGAFYDMGMDAKILATKNGVIQVTLHKPDSKFALTYSFRANQNCWMLAEIESLKF